MTAPLPATLALQPLRDALATAWPGLTLEWRDEVDSTNVELMRRAGDSPIATTPRIVQLALFRAPAVAEQIFPFAALFGGMFALLTLSRKLELVVARSVGLSGPQALGRFVRACFGLTPAQLRDELRRRAAGVRAGAN